MGKKDFPKVEDVIQSQSPVILELLLARELNKVEHARIKKHSSMLLGIAFLGKDTCDERGANAPLDEFMMDDSDFSIIEETFSRESFAILLDKVDVTRLSLEHLNAFYSAAKKSNQFLNFIDLVITHQRQTKVVWLTRPMFEKLVKESIESPRLSFKDFEGLLNKLFVHFMSVDGKVLDDIFNYAIYFGQLNHLDILLNFYNKINSKVVEIQMPEGMFFNPTKKMKEHQASIDQLKENLQNTHTSLDVVLSGGFEDF